MEALYQDVSTNMVGIVVTSYLGSKWLHPLLRNLTTSMASHIVVVVANSRYNDVVYLPNVTTLHVNYNNFGATAILAVKDNAKLVESLLKNTCYTTQFMLPTSLIPCSTRTIHQKFRLCFFFLGTSLGV